MEDKRTLLAFLVIGVVLLLLPYYYEWAGLAPKPPASAVKTEAPDANEKTTAVGAHVPASDRAPETVREPKAVASLVSESEQNAPGQVREIVVTTPLQRMTFSTAGGVLTSCSLVAYQRGNGSAVYLVPAGSR